MLALDLTYINSITEGDKNSINEFIDLFIEEINEFYNNFLLLYNNEDWKNLSILAHKGKTTVFTFGLKEFSNNYLRKLEFYSKHFRLQELNSINLKSEIELNEIVLIENQLENYFNENNILRDEINKEEIKNLILSINKKLDEIKIDIISIRI